MPNVLRRPSPGVLAAVVGIALATALSMFYAVKMWTGRITALTPAPCATPGCLDGTLVDFRDTVWLPTRWFLVGNDPYDTAVYAAQFPYAQDFPTYAPAHLALWLPFGRLPWDVAAAADILVNVAVVAAVGAWAGMRVMRLWCAPGTPDRTSLLAAGSLGIALTWLARTAADGASHGQPSVVYALLAAPALLSRRPWVAVVLTAVTCLKPQIGLFVVVILLAQRRWRIAAAAVLLAAAVSAATGLVLARNSGGIGAWLQTLLGNASSAEAIRTVDYLDERVDLMGALLHAGVPAAGWMSLLFLVTGLAVAYAVAHRLDRRALPNTAVLLGLGIGLMAFYHISYDAMWLLAPVALAATELLRTGGRRAAVVTAPGLVALAAACWASRWHPLELMFGDGSTIWIMRALVGTGLALLTVGIWRLLRQPTDELLDAVSPRHQPSHAGS
ncbi:glycosyltransferase 87 family protein [Mycolicibacterium baixiangningiae]|uniref:glycosyltransferase 87 family protein n=1 Tax=Mycolicibacterium baixiangningiae TaxID=2761578 RepID=UPI001868309A|nr:glycosyltransferase 87 family protein [Mycolicibacterium baixiangningiae]